MTQLRRELGLAAAVSIVIGTIIGSGIFRVSQGAVQQVGTPGTVFFIWVFGGLLSLAGALTYAELAAAMPEAGGEYVYLREAYGPYFGFIYGWTQFWVAKSGSIATLATALFDYFSQLVPEIGETAFIIPLPLGAGGQPLDIHFSQLLAMAVILILAVVNYFGVKAGGNLQIVLTILKVLLIGGIVAFGIFGGKGSTANFHTSVVAPGGVGGFFAALVGILWAYDGWNNVSMVSSEIKEPQRNLPKALIAGTLAVVVIYLLCNAAYFYVLPAQEVANSNRVAAAMMNAVLGPSGAALVAVAVMVSIFAALNGSILTGARVPFALARDGLFFRAIGKVHPERQTPGNSIFWLSAVGAVLVLSGRYEQLFTYVVFASWILYGMATASVMVLRRKRPDLKRPYKTIGYPFVPIVFVLVAALLIFFTLRDSPRESLMGLTLIAAGTPFYFYWKRKLSLTGKSLVD